MSHNITNTDNVFSVREPMWHRLFEPLPDYPTRVEAQAMVHPWEPISEPLYRREPVIAEDGTMSEEFVQVEDVRLNVRSDNGAPLGPVTDTYVTVTNNEMWDIAETIQGDASDVRYETGGSLLGGRKVWVLLRLNEPLLINGDPNGATIPYYALQNSHDGTGAFRGQATMTRIVCDNTSQMADIDADQRGTSFVFHHTKNVRERVEEARVALAGWRESVQAYRLASEVLLSAKVNADQIREFITEFIPRPPLALTSERVQVNVNNARAELLGILKSETGEGIRTTAYGLVQAAIEYQQHYRRARSEETRFRRAYLDRSTVVADAVDIARRVAHV